MRPLPVFVQYQGEVYAGSMIAWRNVEGITHGVTFGAGLVRFRRFDRDYELWFTQGAIRPANPDDDSVPDEAWTAEAVERFLSTLQEDQTDT